MSKRTGNTSVSSTGIQSLESKSAVHRPPQASTQESTLSFGDLLRKYRLLKKATLPELADLLGVSRNTIINWESDKTRPDISAIQTLCLHLDIPLYELFGITGDTKSHLSARETSLLDGYRQLSTVNQNVVTAMVDKMLEEEQNSCNSYLINNFSLLPLESTPAAAGTGCAFTDAPPEYLFIKKNRYSTNADALIRVSGASMEPLYHDGDLVYVCYTQAVEDGDDVICSTADGAVIKRLHNHKLHSLNKNLPFGEKSEDDHVAILGKVLGIASEDEFASDSDVPQLEELKAADVRAFKKKYGLL